MKNKFFNREICVCAHLTQTRHAQKTCAEMRKKMKRLTKSYDKKLCGVCGGIAEYFNIDPTLVRIGWVLLVLCAGTGVLAYIIAAILMPEE